MNVSNNGAILKYEGPDEGNVPTYSMVKVGGSYPKETYSPYLSIYQTWGLQIGIRYIFN